VFRKLGQHNALIQLHQQHTRALTGRDAQVAAYIAGVTYLDQNQLTAAAKLLPAATNLPIDDPLHDDALYHLAVTHYRAQDFDAMQRTLQRLSRESSASPFVPAGEFLRAISLIERDMPHQALPLLTRLIEENPHNYRAPALLQRAQVYTALQNDAAAAADYAAYFQPLNLQGAGTEAALTASDQRAAVDYLDALHRLGQHEQSAALASALLRSQLNPEREPAIRLRLAQAQLRQAQFDAALTTLDALDRDLPGHPHPSQTRYYRGLILTQAQQNDQAIPLLTAAGNDDQLPDALRINAWRVAWAVQRDGANPEPAITALRAVESIAGRERLNSDERLWMGRTLVDQNQPREALGYLEPMAAVNADNAIDPALRSQAIYHIGRALIALEDNATGQQAFKQVIALGRGYELQARLALAHAMTDARQFEAALSEYAALIPSETSAVASEALYESGRVYSLIATERQRAGDDAGVRIADRESVKFYKRLTLLYPFPELSPIPQRAHLALFDAAVRAGNDEDADRELNEIITRYPETGYDLLAQGLLASRERRTNEAVFLLKKARDAQQSDPVLRERADTALRGIEGGR